MIVQVALPYPVSRLFSYNVPSHLESFLFPSQRVKVPFRERNVKGYIISIEEGENPDLKEIVELLDIAPIIPSSLIKLIEWMKDTFLVPYGVLLKYALSDVLTIEDYVEIDAEGSDLHGLTLKKAYKKYGRERIFSLFSSGKIRMKDVFFHSIFPFSERKEWESGSLKKLFIGPFERRLKIYLDEIEAAFRKNKNCLFFVPPYGLSGKVVYDFLAKYYPGRVLWYGHEIKKKERIKIFFALGTSSPYLVLSNVSGLFLPLSNPGLVIIERPEDESYIMDTRFSINVAESAMKRCEIEGIPLVTGSISPPLSFIHRKDSFTEVKEESPHPFSIHTPSAKDDHRSIIGALKSIVLDAVNRNEDVAIFTPRKYYSGKIECMECKETFTCSSCKANLCLSKEKKGIFCPRCELVEETYERCRRCGSSLTSLKAFGAEFFKESLEKEIPQIPVYLVTSETVEKDLMNRLLEEKKSGRLLLVGTSVLSFLYGLGSENLIFVNWRELKRIWKYTAYERMHQLFMNLLDALKPKRIFFVGGKKGDLEIKYMMDPSMFRTVELKKREELNFPPSKSLVIIELSRRDVNRLERMGKKIEEYLRREGLYGYIYGQKREEDKSGYHLKIVLSGLTPEMKKKLFPLFDLYGVTLKVGSDRF